LIDSMDQPLWQNWLNIALIGFVARRAAMAVALQWESLNAALRAGYVVVLVACAFAAIAVWLSVRWVIGALCAVAATFTVASLMELGHVEPAVRTFILLQLAVAIAGTVALVSLARRNARHPQT
jgi:hypothetical protein